MGIAARGPRCRASAAAGVVVLVALLLFGWTMARPTWDDVIDATAPDAGGAARLAQGAERCQPIGARRLPGGRLMVAAMGPAVVEARVRRGAQVVAAGGPRRGRGEVTVPLSPAVPAGTEPLQVCLRNAGTAPISLRGTSDAIAVRVQARASVLDGLGDICDRFAAARGGDVRGGLLLAALLLAAAAAAAGLRLLILRSASNE